MPPVTDIKVFERGSVASVGRTELRSRMAISLLAAHDDFRRSPTLAWRRCRRLGHRPTRCDSENKSFGLRNCDTPNSCPSSRPLVPARICWSSLSLRASLRFMRSASPMPANLARSSRAVEERRLDARRRKHVGAELAGRLRNGGILRWGVSRGVLSEHGKDVLAHVGTVGMSTARNAAHDCGNTPGMIADWLVPTSEGAGVTARVSNSASGIAFAASLK